MRWIILALSIACSASLLGCNRPGPDSKTADGTKKSEEDIKQAFASLQAAVKAKDVDRIWSLLAKDTRGDAEREAKAVKEAFSKLAAADRPAYEKKVGLSAKELTEMTAKLYVKSSTFFTGETAEMPDAKFDKVVMTSAAAATLHYVEEEGKGQRETRAVVLEDGQWRFVLPVSKAVLK